MAEGIYNLDLNELHLPPSPPVEEVQVMEMTDSLGDPAVRVWVVIKESVPDKERGWSHVRPIEEEIRKFMMAKYNRVRYPYFTFLTPKELKKERRL